MPGTGARCCGQGRMEGVEWVLWLIAEAICAACSSAGRTCCTMRPAAWSNCSWSWGDGWLSFRLLEIQQYKSLVYTVMNDAGMLYPHSFRAAIKSSSLATFFTLPASATILESGKAIWTVISGNCFTQSLRASFRQVLISATELAIGRSR